MLGRGSAYGVRLSVRVLPSLCDHGLDQRVGDATGATDPSTDAALSPSSGFAVPGFEVHPASATTRAKGETRPTA